VLLQSGVARHRGKDGDGCGSGGGSGGDRRALGQLLPLSPDGRAGTGVLGGGINHEFEVWIRIRSHTCVADVGMEARDVMCFIFNELTCSIDVDSSNCKPRYIASLSCCFAEEEEEGGREGGRFIYNGGGGGGERLIKELSFSILAIGRDQFF